MAAFESTVSARTECPPLPETASKTCARSSPMSVPPAADRPPSRQSKPPLGRSPHAYVKAVLSRNYKNAAMHGSGGQPGLVCEDRLDPAHRISRVMFGAATASLALTLWAITGYRLQIAVGCPLGFLFAFDLCRPAAANRSYAKLRLK